MPQLKYLYIMQVSIKCDVFQKKISFSFLKKVYKIPIQTE